MTSAFSYRICTGIPFFSTLSALCNVQMMFVVIFTKQHFAFMMTIFKNTYKIKYITCS